MSIDARIASVAERGGCIHLRLVPYRASDGVMSIPGRNKLLITHYTRRPHAGQKIWGNAGHCIVEGGDGERIMYARQGSFLREQAE